MTKVGVFVRTEINWFVRIESVDFVERWLVGRLLSLNEKRTMGKKRSITFTTV